MSRTGMVDDLADEVPPPSHAPPEGPFWPGIGLAEGLRTSGTRTSTWSASATSRPRVR